MAWSGVYPTITTQYRRDELLDLNAAQRPVVQQLDDGVDGIVALGTCGTRALLSVDEKISVLRALGEALAQVIRALKAAMASRPVLPAP